MLHGDGNDDEAVGRRRHYEVFYGDVAPPEGFGIVVGNCQAESIRIVIDSPAVSTVRVPAIHEMTAQDAVHLHDLLSRASFLVSQPVRDDYHDLPLGTRQLSASLRAGVPTVTITPIRFAGLYPFQVAMRVPGIHEVPPLVEYHDVRSIAAAAGLPITDRLSPEQVHAIGAESLTELRRREAKTHIPVADLFDQPAFAQMRTVNHPGNAVFLPVAGRILQALRVDAPPTDPGRPLLSAVQAPREEWVADAWGTSESPRPFWLVGGQQLSSEVVADAHREWYARHPLFVSAAVERLQPLLTRWGLV